MRQWKIVVLLVGLMMFLPTVGHCRFGIMGTLAPVERLIPNTIRYVKAHPKDVEGYYTLGRIYSLAFAQGPKSAEAYRARDKKHLLPIFHPGQAILNQRYPKTRPITKQDITYLRESVRNYSTATQMAPKNALYWLGLGWMLEEGAPCADKAGRPWDNKTQKAKSTTDEWRNLSLVAYRKVFSLQAASDSKREFRGPAADSTLSVEAGEGIERLLKAKKQITNAEKQELQTVQAHLAKMQRKGRVVTPIILPLGQKTTLSNLLSPNKSVQFDLAGANSGQRWPWVTKNAGILVWDANHSGKITSGRQLFGSVTWWIFWKNGYEALAALDDNGDGILRGDELNGISIWRDANGNGVSEVGEVQPLSYWKIMALATRATEKVEGMPANGRGFERDGVWLPSYDWTPRSLN